MDKLPWRTTPRSFKEWTLSTPGRGGGRGMWWSRWGPLGETRSSWVLVGLRRRLLEVAQELMWASSVGMVEVREDGTMRNTSSAYLTRILPGEEGNRSDALAMKAACPTAEPWRTLAEIMQGLEVESKNLV